MEPMETVKVKRQIRVVSRKKGNGPWVAVKDPVWETEWIEVRRPRKPSK
jgi:hypothetical protein